VDTKTSHASCLTDALDQITLTHATLADEDQILISADEVALGQCFDLRAIDGGIEVPIELTERLEIAEPGIVDPPFDAPLTAQTGLIGKQPMQEVQVRQTGVLSVLKNRVELSGGDRDAQSGEVGQNLLTCSRGRGCLLGLGGWGTFAGRHR